jgi:hypothetical protein
MSKSKLRKLTNGESKLRKLTNVRKLTNGGDPVRLRNPIDIMVQCSSKDIKKIEQDYFGYSTIVTFKSGNSYIFDDTYSKIFDRFNSPVGD